MFCPSVRYERNLSFLRKMSLFTALRNRNEKGSITLETAVVLPFFLFFLLAFCSFFQVLHVQSRFQEQLFETARELAVISYGEEETHAALNSLYIQGMLQKACPASYLKQMGVRFGRAGIRTEKSRIREGNERIDLRADFCVETLFALPVRKDVEAFSRAAARAWTGYDGSSAGAGGSSSGMVYRTVSGSVIHTDPECSYLNPSVTAADPASVAGRRNLYGERYRPCELCPKGAAGQVYITDTGNRYHTSLGCSGLKRTVLAIPVDEAEDCPVCSKCAGGR